MATIRRIDTRLLGIVILVVCAVFGYFSWKQDSAVEDTQDCMIAAFTDRDTANEKSRDAAIRWMDEFIQFLEDIETQTSVQPLINSAKNYRGKIQDSGVVVSVTSLKECK